MSWFKESAADRAQIATERIDILNGELDIALATIERVRALALVWSRRQRPEIKDVGQRIIAVLDQKEKQG